MNPIFRFGAFQGDPSRDVREELESHLELEVEALMMEEGMSAAEARSVAEKKLGSRRRIEMEATRYAARLDRRRRWAHQVDTLRQDLGYALRTLLRSPGATFLTIVLLALGVGANTALFSMFKGVVLEPLGLPDADELVFLWEVDADGQSVRSSFANFTSWQEQSRTIQEMGAYLARHVNLTGEGESERVRGALATSSLFSVFGVRPALGRPFLPEEDFSDIPVVVLEHEVWQRRYGGDPEIVGKDIGLDGVPHRVVGVMPPGFQHPDPGGLEPIQVWVPLPGGTEREPRRSRSFQVIGRVTTGTPLFVARAELDGVAQQLAEAFPETNGEMGIRLDSAHETLFGEAGKQILLVLGAAALVLLIACGNIASLQLSRSAMRRGEMAVRGALGGSRLRILRQLLTENLLLALAGGVAGILVAGWALALLRGFAPPEFPRAQGVQLDGAVLLFSMALSLAVGVLFGLAPGLSAVRVPVATILKEDHGRAGAGSGGSGIQNAFIIGQIALSLILGNAALLLLQSQGALKENELGFQTRDVLTMELSLRGEGYSLVRGRAEFYDELLPVIRGLPGVEAAGASTSLPMGARATAEVVVEEDWADGSQAEIHALESDRIAGDFFTALGVPVVSGRTFVRGEDDPRFRDSRAILNQSAASLLWPGEDALGRRFSYAGEEAEWLTVVGVAADTRNGSLGLDPVPEIYLPYASFPTGRLFLAIKTTGDPLALAPAVLQEIRRVDSRQAVSQIRTMEEVVGTHLSRREFYTTLLTVFAALACTLVAAGIFGGVSQFVASRRQEMGIRMALGSAESDLMGLILGRAGRLAALGLTLGLAGVYLSRSFFQAYLYGVGPFDPLTLLGGVAILLAVAVLAAVAPARRACKVDPVDTLKGM